MATLKNKFNRVATDNSQLQEFTDKVCETLDNGEGEMKEIPSTEEIEKIVNEGIKSGEINTKLKIELVDSISVENVSGAIPISKEVLDKVGDLFIICIEVITEGGSSNVYSGLCLKSPITLLGFSEDTDYDGINLDIENEPPLITLTNNSIEGDYLVKVYSINL